MSNNKPLTPSSIILLLITVILWGWAFPLIKGALDFVPPLVIGYFRYFFASLPFIFYIFFNSNFDEIKRELRINWPILLTLGITMVTIPNIAQNIGLLYTTSSIAALITSVAPVFTVMLGVYILGESKTWQKFIGLTIAISASIIMVLYTGFEVENASLFGNVLILITSISYGISGFFSKTALSRCKPTFVTGFSMLFGSIILMPLSILFNEPIDWIINLPLDGWIYLISLTLFPCMVATFLWYVVLQGHEVSKQVLFTYLIPVFAALFAYLMLKETLQPVTIFLGILIILGIGIAESELIIKNQRNKIQLNQ